MIKFLANAFQLQNFLYFFLILKGPLTSQKMEKVYIIIFKAFVIVYYSLSKMHFEVGSEDASTFNVQEELAIPTLEIDRPLIECIRISVSLSGMIFFSIFSDFLSSNCNPATDEGKFVYHLLKPSTFTWTVSSSICFYFPANLVYQSFNSVNRF